MSRGIMVRNTPFGSEVEVQWQTETGDSGYSAGFDRGFGGPGSPGYQAELPIVGRIMELRYHHDTDTVADLDIELRDRFGADYFDGKGLNIGNNGSGILNLDAQVELSTNRPVLVGEPPWLFISSDEAAAGTLVISYREN